MEMQLHRAHQTMHDSEYFNWLSETGVFTVLYVLLQWLADKEGEKRETVVLQPPWKILRSPFHYQKFLLMCKFSIMPWDGKWLELNLHMQADNQRPEENTTRKKSLPPAQDCLPRSRTNPSPNFSISCSASQTTLNFCVPQFANVT